MSPAPGTITALTADTAAAYNVRITKGYDGDGPTTHVADVPVIAWAAVTTNPDDDPDNVPTRVEPVFVLEGTAHTSASLTADFGHDYGTQLVPAGTAHPA